MSQILLLSEQIADKASIVGSKAARLGALMASGLPVPDGFVITIPTDENIRTSQIQKEILAAWDTLGLSLAAVRSSAVGEDNILASWAGQLHTSLAVSKEEVFTHIQMCRESFNQLHTHLYARQLHIPALSQLAIIVQAMIPSELSGIIFTAHPVTGDCDVKVIEVVFGLGELLAQGQVSASHYQLHSDGSLIAAQYPGQENKLMITSDGLHLINLPDMPAAHLTSSQLQQLLRFGKDIEGIFGQPQDIEWTIVGNQWWILQSRPITTL